LKRSYSIGLVLIVMQIAFSGYTFGANYNLVIPDRHRLEDSRLPHISTNNPVRVVAEHNNVPLPVRMCTIESGVYHTKMDDLTDAAVASLEDVLKRKNIQVKADAIKVLHISISEAHCVIERPSFWKSFFNYTVKLTVSFDDDIIKEFTGSHGTGSGMAANSSISDAINYAVCEMLKDEEIINYLKR
jgi:hypothetical protein